MFKENINDQIQQPKVKKERVKEVKNVKKSNKKQN